MIKKGKQKDGVTEKSYEQLAPYQFGIIIAVALILLVVFLYTIEIIISPFIIAGAIIFILYPLRKNIIARRLYWISIILFLMWFFYMTMGVLTPFIISFGIAYVLNPLVSWCYKKRIPRWAASLGILMLVTLIVGIALMLLLPLLFDQFNDLIQSVTGAIEDIGIWLREGTLIEWLDGYGIPSEHLREFIDGDILPLLEDLTMIFVEGVFNLFITMSGYITQIINMVVIPFLTFYLLKDFQVVKRRVKMFIPDEFRPTVVHYYRKIDHMLGRYIRGYIVLATINGTLAGLLLWSFGIKYPAVLGVVAGLLDFIPYLGLIATMVIAAIVAFLSEPPILMRVFLAVSSIGFLTILENYLLAPYILGRPIGLHPVVLILSLLIFWYFLGFVGLLIALPATATLIIILREWEKRESDGMVE